MNFKFLSSCFYARDTVLVAKELIGKLLVRAYQGKILIGVIAETEAYHAYDPACHAHKGKTKRNASLFGPVGHAYVYFTYGCHFCMNVVARDETVLAGGVLIRGIIPIKGIDTMQKLRGDVPTKNLANGPGKLTKALAIDRTQGGINLTQKGELFIAHSKIQSLNIIATPRIGISKATDKLWRFVVDTKSVMLKI